MEMTSETADVRDDEYWEEITEFFEEEVRRNENNAYALAGLFLAHMKRDTVEGISDCICNVSREDLDLLIRAAENAEGELKKALLPATNLAHKRIQRLEEEAKARKQEELHRAQVEQERIRRQQIVDEQSKMLKEKIYQVQKGTEHITKRIIVFLREKTPVVVFYLRQFIGTILALFSLGLIKLAGTIANIASKAATVKGDHLK